MASVDSLNIEISATAASANKELNNLIQKVQELGIVSRELSTAVKNIGLDDFAKKAASSGKSLSNFSGMMKNLSEGMKNLSGIKVEDFTPIADGIKKFADIDAGQISSIGNALQPLANGINTLSNANFDDKNLQNLINSLTRLSNANVGGLANADFTAIGSSIKTLASTLSGAESVQQNTISLTNSVARLARSAESIPTVSSSLPKLSKSLEDFINSMSGASSISEGAISLTQAIASLSNSGAKVGAAAGGLGALGTELKDLMKTLSTAPTVSQNLIDMTNALANLARTGASSGRAADSLSKSFNNISVSSVRTIKPLQSMRNVLKDLFRVVAPFIGLYEIFRFGKNAIETASSLKEVQNVVDVTFSDMAYKVEDFAQNSIEQFGMSELSVKQIASRFQAMGTAMNIDTSGIEKANKFLNEQTGGYIGLSDSMADVSLNLTKLTADMASFYNVEQDVVAEDLASIFTGMARPLRDYGLDLTQATLQEWAMKNGLDADIQSMSQAEKALLRYQYVLSQSSAAQNDFSRTADSWANSVRILKQQFQQFASVIGTGLIAAFKPFVQTLNSVMQKVVQFAKVVVNALGKIFGWKMEISTSGITDNIGGVAGVSNVADVADYADQAAGGLESGAEAAADEAGNINKAQKAAKKLKDYTLGIDELNIVRPDDVDALDDATDTLDKLGKPSEGSGGMGGSGHPGGSGAGAGGGDLASSLVKTDSIFEEFESEIDTLYELGEYIGDALSRAMESINWDSVYQKARNFGRGLADFLNGLISPGLFGNIGKTVAGSLNTALYSLNSFGETFDWNDFGLSIATGVNNFFATFDFALLADTIDLWVQGIWATIKTTLTNIDWGTVWDSVKEFLSNIDLETVAIVIGAISIKKILSLNLASTAFAWIGGEISKKIAQAIASKLGVEIAANAGIGTALKTGLASAFSRISGMGILDIGKVFTLGTFADKIAFVSKMLGGIALIAGGVTTAASNFMEMFNGGFNWLNEALMVLGTALAAVGAVILGAPALVAGVVAGIVAAVGTIVVVVHDNWDAITEWFSGVADWFNSTVIVPITGFFQGLWQNVSGFFNNLWNDIVGIWGTMSGWFSSTVIEPIAGFFQGLWSRIKQIFEGLWIIVKAVWIVASDWFNQHIIIPIVRFFGDLWTDVRRIFSRLWSDIKNIWNTVAGWFDTNIIRPVTSAFKGLWTAVSGFFSQLWSDIKNIWNTVAEWFDTNVAKPIGTTFDNVTSAISKAFDGVWSAIKGGVVGAMNAVIGGIETAINWIVGGINKIIGGFNKVVSWAAKVAEVDWGGVDLVHEVHLGRIQAYATGGFPDNGELFMARENGTNEMVGRIGSQSAVANNDQIVLAIQGGVKEAVKEALAPYLQAIMQNTQETAKNTSEGKSITIDGRELVAAYDSRKARNGYSFT